LPEAMARPRMTSDVSDLERFVRAQDDNDTYARVHGELRDGHKRSHWMWFVFPQIVGLSSSTTGEYFGISGLSEARTYFLHPVLGVRLLECTDLVLQAVSADAEAIFGPTDALKLRSSMTLFRRAAPEASRFAAVIERFFQGVDDPRTVALLG
jgi:uncharacterized protein (DUF1810 family)